MSNHLNTSDRDRILSELNELVKSYGRPLFMTLDETLDEHLKDLKDGLNSLALLFECYDQQEVPVRRPFSQRLSSKGQAEFLIDVYQTGRNDLAVGRALRL